MHTTDTKDKILDFIWTNKGATNKQLQVHTGISSSGVFQHLNRHLKNDKIVRMGKHPKWTYHLSEKSINAIASKMRDPVAERARQEIISKAKGLLSESKEYKEEISRAGVMLKGEIVNKMEASLQASTNVSDDVKKAFLKRLESIKSKTVGSKLAGGTVESAIKATAPQRASTDLPKAAESNVIHSESNISKTVGSKLAGGVAESSLPMASKVFGRMLEAIFGSDVVHLTKGISHIYKRNLEVALVELNKAIEISPKYSIAFERRGAIYLVQKNYPQAIADYSRAIALDPKDAAAYKGRGFAYFMQGDFTLALADCNKAIELTPYDAQAYDTRSLVYFYLKDYDRAWADVHKVESLRGKVNPRLLEELKKASGRER